MKEEIFEFIKKHRMPLFLALVIILVIFPYSVFSLGLWMSFLATLGLVTVYPMLERMIPYKKDRILLVKLLKRLSRGVVLTVGMTVVANVFLLPIQWYYFGEMSLSAVPANLLLASLTPLYMILSVISIAFGGIPFLGDMPVRAVDLMTHVILWITERFSYLDMATVSLRYWFADVLVVLFTLTMIVFLVIRLPKRWVVVIPIASFAVLFSAFVTVYSLNANSTLTFTQEAMTR